MPSFVAHSKYFPRFAALVISIAFLLSFLPPCLADVQQSRRVASYLGQFEDGDISADELSSLLQSAASRELGRDGFAFDDPELRDQIGEAFVRRTKDILLKKSSADAVSLRAASKQILGERNSYARKVDRFIYVAERAELLEIGQDAVKMDSFSEEISDEFEKTIVNRRKSTMFHRMAQAANGSNRPERAIRFLSELESRFWRETTPSLFIESLRLLAQKIQVAPTTVEFWPFANDEVIASVTRIRNAEVQASERDAFQQSLAILFGHRAVEQASVGNAQAAEKAFKKMLLYRPDVSKENDNVRYDIVLAAQGPAADGFAQQRLNELFERGMVSLTFRLRLLLSGYYGSLFPLLVYGILAFFIGIITLFLVKPSALVFQRASGAARVHRARSRGAGYMMEATFEDEYSRLLAMFGLDETASKEQIRKAYRDAAKSYHPDSLTGFSEEEKAQAADRFDELKRAYDRIMEFRDTQFGSFRPPSD